MYDDVFRSNLLEGMQKFQGARSRAFWSDIIAHLRGQSTELLSYEDIRARLRLHEESYRGLQDVPLDQIQGSVGRYREFNTNFLPKRAGMQERWSRVYAKANSMEGLPPIDVYKVGDVYFVRDGNHRVSVARQLGAKTIQANVTEVNTPVHIYPNMTLEEIDGATAYAAFLDEAGFNKTMPNHEPMNLSERWRYPELLQHIYTHRYILEGVMKAPVSIEDAALHWYDNIFKPAIDLIREHGIMRLIPGRTEADLYLWMVSHLREVEDEYGSEDGTVTYSQALVDFLAQNNIAIPEELQNGDDNSLRLNRQYIDQAMNVVKTTDEDVEIESTEADDDSTE